ncbi:MAG: DNA mismatch repair protein MutS [Candidatus Omnitrophica bacterium]|nr:DNA mismatch repair protein MutS [Candidatus Omnitrophota bacterium]
MENLTPMLKQYHEVKANHRDSILFFRLGDFYEMFYADAVRASKILGLVLTSRGSGRSGKVPMCGVPFHASESYIAKLVKAGEKIAICEQVEDPAQAQGIVRRDVVRIVTSGTFIDDQNSDPRYILALAPYKNLTGIAFTETSNGTILANQYDYPEKVIETITKLPVYECVYPSGQEQHIRSLFQHPVLRQKKITLSPYEDWAFNAEIAQKTLTDHFGTRTLKGFGIDEKSSLISSAGALLEYLRRMHHSPMKHINRVGLYEDSEYMHISPAAVHGLELEQLFSVINRTRTAMGKRALRYWLYHPLKNTASVRQRQDAVETLKENDSLRAELIRIFREIPDVEKSISKISCGYTHPRDLLALRGTLQKIPRLQELLHAPGKSIPLFRVPDEKRIRELLKKAVNPEIPPTKFEGKVIREGFHPDLDELRSMRESGNQWLKNYQREIIERTGIQSLKIGFNKVFGYYIEVTKTHLKSIPQEFIRKQTLVNSERYITPELKEFEEKMLTAGEKLIQREKQILQQLQQEILAASEGLLSVCAAVARIDALTALSDLANEAGYRRPKLTEDDRIEISGGRHPVVEQLLPGTFIPNDTRLNSESDALLIITGPNMSGKSTYIRQTGILVILAQIGSFLPADRAVIGVVDKLFTRIGAHDEIAKGQSTFMVEMNETAEILNNLSSRSLVILDEIGRGTSTYDGLSLAWAVAEHLQAKKTRTLFATHFHELTGLADEFSGVKNYNVSVKEWGEEIVFLHKIVPGGTDDSYGIYVAKLAGIPAEVVTRAKQILSHLELQGSLKEKIRNLDPGRTQFTLFKETHPRRDERYRRRLRDLNLAEYTPLQALNLLNRWQEEIKEEEGA